ncbi:MAG TPA: RidA family protein [Kiloniellales bacterium]|nr:RidA family protein [Kiloniellales bacterium]
MTSAQGPLPQGVYATATRHGNFIFTAGMTPREAGVLKFEGVVPADADPAKYRAAAELACRNALMAVERELAEGEEIAAVLSMTVFIAARPGFALHSRIADFASEFLRASLGERGVAARAAVGVASLPGDAPVEIQLVAVVR